MLKLKINKPTDIHVQDMKDGDIGVIIQWPLPYYIGVIVQRYANDLICIGAGKEDRWEQLFAYPREYKNCYVRLLEKGEELVVE